MVKSCKFGKKKGTNRCRKTRAPRKGSRSFGEIKRTGKRRTQAAKAAERTHGTVVGHTFGTRRVAVRATIGRDTGAVGSKRQGDYIAEVCIPLVSGGKGHSRGVLQRRKRLKQGWDGRCGRGGGRTPTAALRNAFKKLGKTLE